MDIIQAIEERHAVRSYKDKEIEPEKVEELNQEIEKCNKLGNLNIQLILNEQRRLQALWHTMVNLIM